MQTIDALIKESCTKYPDKTALSNKIGGIWQDMSYGALWTLSGQIAAGLISQGFKPGEQAAILAASSPRWVAAYLGILRAGGVVVPIDKELKSAELRHVLTDCSARMIFTDRPYLDQLLEIINELGSVQKIITIYPPPQKGGADLQTAKIMDELVDEWHRLVSSTSIPPEKTARIENLASQVHRLLTRSVDPKSVPKDIQNFFSPVSATLNSLLRSGRLIELDSILSNAPLPPSPRRENDTAVLLYTSGTTGRSKGAMLSHANIVSNIKAGIEHFTLDNTIHTLSFLPINHVFEQVCGVLLPLSLGGKVSFVESLKKLGENLSEVKPTFFLAVPAVYRMIFDRITKNIETKKLSKILFSFPLTRPIVTSKIRQTFGSGTKFISGGAALDPVVAKGLMDLGLNVFQGYGITETSPIIAAEKPGGKRLGTVGTLLRDIEVRIDHPNEENVGEIVVKGPNVMQGYYNNPQATAEVLQNGWYRTGDLGKMDADGYLSICGRVKNLIVTPNGKNVYPEEVEHELLNSPLIAEVMVYGHKLGPAVEEVHAIIYPNQEALDDYCRLKGNCPMNFADVEMLIKGEVSKACDNLAEYKRVKKFTLREDEFPKTTTRKIKRFAVEARISTKD